MTLSKETVREFLGTCKKLLWQLVMLLRLLFNYNESDEEPSESLDW